MVSLTEHTEMLAEPVYVRGESDLKKFSYLFFICRTEEQRE